MREARVFVRGSEAGVLREISKGSSYTFEYLEAYSGLEVSRTMMPDQEKFSYSTFPPFFEGLLPEGLQLEGLLKGSKIDKNDYFSQLMTVGEDLIGVVTVKEIVR